MDNRVVIPIGIREEVMNALHFGHPGLTKMENESKIFWWPNMTEDLKEKEEDASPAETPVRIQNVKNH